MIAQTRRERPMAMAERDIRQLEEIDRILKSYPHLVDDEFVLSHRDRWLR